MKRTRESSLTDDNNDTISPSSSSRPQPTKKNDNTNKEESPPLYIKEGLFAVYKPLEWTSQDVVGYIRKLLERDARERGCIRPKKRRKPWIKIGHGGTLDPLATGVLVIGIGSGTKKLQQYLDGSKKYKATVQLGKQTSTLDLDPKGEIVTEKPYDHVTYDSIQKIIPEFTGQIEQIPPMYSALKIDGKKMYELARNEGKTEDDIEIKSRKVQIYDLSLSSSNNEEKPVGGCFDIDVECGGGTYIRSLVRDIGFSLNTVATMSKLERTKQGIFEVEDCLVNKDDWSDPMTIYSSLRGDL